MTLQQRRQPALSTQIARDSQRLVSQLAKTVPAATAVSWVHAAALARHAVAVGLAEAGDVRKVLEQVAAAHPALACWTDPAVVPLWAETPTASDLTAIDAFWNIYEADVVLDEHRRWWSYPIGDLYQTLSDEARKGRALCQTPWFVTELLLKTTYDRAVEVWDDPQVIDPACGTGHLLVEAAMHANSSRLSDLPALGRITTALDAIHGVDLDPYAVAVTRYRLAVMGLAWLHSYRGVKGWEPLDVLPDLPIHVAAADSLLAADEGLLDHGRYHVVVANPPYITCKNADQNTAIRRRWPQVCSGTFSLAVPFEPLMHQLTVPGGWVARLTANSFMKREFGKKLIEDYFPTIDMQWVIDTSGAYIPGHGTPTVILVSRNQPPTGDTIRAVQGIRGEPKAPDDPATGVVWSAIRDAVYARESAERFCRGAELAAGISQPEPPTPLPVARRDMFEQAGLWDEEAAS